MQSVLTLAIVPPQEEDLAANQCMLRQSEKELDMYQVSGGKALGLMQLDLNLNLCKLGAPHLLLQCALQVLLVHTKVHGL